MLGSFWRKPDKTSSESSDSDLSEPDEGTLSLEKDDGETWVQWIQRSTGIVDNQLKKASIDDWIVAQRKRKWRLAGHTARRDDGRWSEVALSWEPSWGRRSRGHPVKRWTQDLDDFFADKDGTTKGCWQQVVQNKLFWKRL